MIREFPLGRSLEPPAECSDDWEHDGIVRISHLKMSSKVCSTLHSVRTVEKTSAGRRGSHCCSVQYPAGSPASRSSLSRYQSRPVVQDAAVGGEARGGRLQ